MKATELRIGNLVSHKLETIEIGKDGKVDYADAYSPIPLPEGWKDKLGFDEDCRLYIPNADDTPSHLYFYWLEEYEIVILTFGDGDIEIAVYNWVHQVQNAWFAITGIELKIEE